MLKALGSIKFFQEISNIFTTQKTKPVLEEAVSFLLLPLRIIKNAIADLETEPAIAITETSTSAITPTTTKVESTSAIAPTTTKVCIGNIKEEGKGKGKTTIEKKSVPMPKKDSFHCDRRYALNDVSPWVNARLTSVFNSIDDYPQEFNTDRHRMAKGLKNWKYQQKYRLTAIDVEKIDYVIECLS